jgi:hypothetical protein
VPLFFYFAFTRPGEYSIHPTLQDTSPDALRSPARQNPLRSDHLKHTLTCVIRVLPFPGVHRCEAAATRSRRRLASSQRVHLALPPQVARAARTARCARRVGRCSLARALLWTGLGSARAQLARRLGCRLCRRLCGPAIRGRWQSRSAQDRSCSLIAARVHAIALDRFDAGDVTHSGVGFWRAPGALCARAKTAQVAGR